MPSSIRLQNSANIATIIVSAVAIVTFILGYKQFRETQLSTRENLVLQKEALEQERESKAIELFVKYNELMRERESEFWRENLVMSIAESIFVLQKDDEAWIQTVKSMLINHEAHFKKVGLNCKTYDIDFIQLINKVFNQNYCLDQ